MSDNDNNGYASLFGIPTTTPSGVPLMTMEQIQQLQQQQRGNTNHNTAGAGDSRQGSNSDSNSNSHLNSSTNNNCFGLSQHGTSQISAGALFPHQHQQYVLGQEVSPITQQQQSVSSLQNSFFGATNSGDGSTTTPTTNYDGFSDAALWKMFWDETNNTTTPAAAAAVPSSSLPEMTSMAMPASQTGSNTFASNAHMYSTETIKTQNPTTRMNSPSPTPSAMSCSTAESTKPHLTVSSSQQQQLQQQLAWPTTTSINPGYIENDQLNMMLQQFYQQQQQVLQQSQQPPQQVQSPTFLPHSMPVATTYSTSTSNQPFSAQYPLRPQAAASQATATTPKINKTQEIITATSLIPSIVMPPSVMTSVMTPPRDDNDSYENQEQQRRRKNTSASNKRATKNFKQESPQHCLDRLLLQTRGFSPGQLRIKAEDAAYDTTPTPLQLASFGTELVRAIHTTDLEKLSEMLSCGLSPNPCNQFRDSIVDLVCKRANASVFKTLVEHGSELRVCDSFGRTPLHHCCWASTFSPDIVMTILQHDWRQLFLEDKRGQTPLEYVREELYDDWINFLQDHAASIVPQHVPGLTSMKLQRPDGALADPPNALPTKLAMAVSAGRITPQQVQQMEAEKRAKFEG